MPPPPRGTMGSGTLHHLTLDLKKCLRLKSWMKKTPVWAALGDSRNKELLLNRKRPQTEPDQAYLVVLSLCYQFQHKHIDFNVALFSSTHPEVLPSSPDEGLEGSTLRIDAQRHPFALLVLRDEAMDQLWGQKQDHQSQTSQRKLTAAPRFHATVPVMEDKLQKSLYIKKQNKNTVYHTHTPQRIIKYLN